MESKIVRIFATFLIAGYIHNGEAILGGELTTIEDIPYQVSILMFGEHRCGGGIIDETHVLTAAHCTVTENNVFLPGLQVLSGTHDLSDKTPFHIHNVIMNLCHGRYQDSIWGEFDIAILKLDGPIFFSPRRHPISLGINDIPNGAEVTIAGWGSECIERCHPAPYLRMLKMTVLSPHICDVLLNRRLDVEVVCAHAYNNTNQGLSNGDSGGLLIYNGEAVGIAFGGAPEMRGLPAVFTRIYNFLPWIEESIHRF